MRWLCTASLDGNYRHKKCIQNFVGRRKRSHNDLKISFEYNDLILSQIERSTVIDFVDEWKGAKRKYKQDVTNNACRDSQKNTTEVQNTGRKKKIPSTPILPRK
jgi:hypothetical protein